MNVRECPICSTPLDGRACKNCGFNPSEDNAVTCEKCGETVLEENAVEVRDRSVMGVDEEVVYYCTECL